MIINHIIAIISSMPELDEILNNKAKELADMDIKGLMDMYSVDT